MQTDDIALEEKVRIAYREVIDQEEGNALHPIVLAAQKYLAAMCLNYPNTVNRVLKSSFDISVTASCLERSIKIADVIVKVFKKLRCKIVTSPSSPFTYINIESYNIQIRIKELSKQVNHIITPEEKKKMKSNRYFNVPTYDLIPIGKLSLSFEGHCLYKRTWGDGKKRKLEESIVEFIVEVIKTPGKLRKIDEDRKIESDRIKQRINAIYDDSSMFDILKSESQDWKLAETIREYTQAVEDRVLTMRIPLSEKNRIRERLEWAKRKANWLDPITAADDPLRSKKHYKRLFFDE